MLILQAIGDNQNFSMLARSLLFYVVINLEAFIFCFAGEYLSIKVGRISRSANFDRRRAGRSQFFVRFHASRSASSLPVFQSNMIGDAAYESLWYDLPPSETRILLLLIMRSQKQLTITVGRFTNLSLQQFANVSFTSVSLREIVHSELGAQSIELARVCVRTCANLYVCVCVCVCMVCARAWITPYNYLNAQLRRYSFLTHYNNVASVSRQIIKSSASYVSVLHAL